MSITPYPLRWPDHIARTKTPERSRFQTSLARARRNLTRDLDLLGANNIVITSNAVLNKNGTIAARQPWISDVGIAVYFTVDGQGRCFACDRWDWMEDNIQAIAKTIEALRGVQRWGTSQMVDAAFAGFAALPAQTAGDAWWDVMGLSSSTVPREVIEANYRALAKRSHPDVGGDPDLWRAIQFAYEQAMQAVAP